MRFARKNNHFICVTVCIPLLSIHLTGFLSSFFWCGGKGGGEVPILSSHSPFKEKLYFTYINHQTKQNKTELSPYLYQNFENQINSFQFT